MLIGFDIQVYDHKNAMLTNITDTKCVRSRNEDTARDRIRAKSDENNSLP